MEAVKWTHSVVPYILVFAFSVIFDSSLGTCQIWSHLEYGNSFIHKAARNSELLALKHFKTVVSDSLCFFTYKQIVGSEGFPEAEFVFLLTWAFAGALVWEQICQCLQEWEHLLLYAGACNGSYTVSSVSHWDGLWHPDMRLNWE